MQDPEIIKRPTLDYSIHPLISSRWSPRAYDTKTIEPEKLQRIFEAARWTASSSNLQPWYFLVGIKGDEVYKKITSSLVEFNKLWTVNVPVLVIAIAKTTNSKGELNNYFAYDLGQAVAVLSLQAMHEGIYTHQMGGFDASALSQLFEIPYEYKVMVVFALGYRGETEILHPKLQKLELNPRKRRPISESVFSSSFGLKADFL